MSSIPQQQIQPEKVTKPIQLLAAWLVGLILTNTIFLGAASRMEGGDWLRAALVLAAIANVPIFLWALFTLQTKFRAELQEDTFYSDYLSKKTAAVVRIDRNSVQDSAIEIMEKKISELERRVAVSTNRFERDISTVSWASWDVALNELHPRYSEIRTALKISNIPVAEIFGKGVNTTLPDQWILSLSYRLPLQNKVALLRALLPFGFDGFQFWTPQREAGELEDVYIGSYGAGKFAPMADELVKLLDGEIDPVDLDSYVSRYGADRTDADDE